MKKKGKLRALTFEYHGIAQSELRSAKSLAAAAGVVEHRVVRLPDLREASDIKGRRFPGMPPVYIPMRNSIFYALAASFAEEVRAKWIVGGHNKDDGKVFRDVGDGFFDSLQKSLWEWSKILDENRTRIQMPLKGLSKAEVVKLAKSLDVPLGLTWSCHRSGRY